MSTLFLPDHRPTRRWPSASLTRFTAHAPLSARVLWATHRITYGLDRPSSSARCWAKWPAISSSRHLAQGLATRSCSPRASRRRHSHHRREKAHELALDAAFLERCRSFLTDPGISVVRDAAVATSAGASTRCTTQPKAAGDRLHELAQASGIGLTIEADAVPVYTETTRSASDGTRPWG